MGWLPAVPERHLERVVWAQRPGLDPPPVDAFAAGYPRRGAEIDGNAAERRARGDGRMQHRSRWLRHLVGAA